MRRRHVYKVTPFTNLQVEAVFQAYPETASHKLLELRELIIQTAKRCEIFQDLEETLKWGEPSYLSPKGSTIRIGWKRQDSAVCNLYFHCQTSLIRTFREIYPELDYEDNRAIRLPLNGVLDRKRLAHCIELALNYHSVKSLPNLGFRQDGAPGRSHAP